jgi:hypothetical protein
MRFMIPLALLIFILIAPALDHKEEPKNPPVVDKMEPQYQKTCEKLCVSALEDTFAPLDKAEVDGEDCICISRLKKASHFLPMDQMIHE